VSAPCDGPPCTYGALTMQTGKSRLETMPELTPFDVEYLRAAGADYAPEPFDFATFCWSRHSIWERRRDARIRLVSFGLLLPSLDITTAGRAVLAALGVS
jgi:hypothetical protein